MSSVLSLAPVRKSQIPRVTEPRYNPNADRRRCGHCGQRDQWVRLEWSKNPGGWYCQCVGVPDTKPDATELRHVCTFACAIGGAA